MAEIPIFKYRGDIRIEVPSENIILKWTDPSKEKKFNELINYGTIRLDDKFAYNSFVMANSDDVTIAKYYHANG